MHGPAIRRLPGRLPAAARRPAAAPVPVGPAATPRCRPRHRTCPSFAPARRPPARRPLHRMRPVVFRTRAWAAGRTGPLLPGPVPPRPSRWRLRQPRFQEVSP
jgi:hypothetical protein